MKSTNHDEEKELDISSLLDVCQYGCIGSETGRRT
jgi:hypothetical protein